MTENKNLSRQKMKCRYRFTMKKTIYSVPKFTRVCKIRRDQFRFETSGISRICERERTSIEPITSLICDGKN
jgi:hypothetical protein